MKGIASILGVSAIAISVYLLGSLRDARSTPQLTKMTAVPPPVLISQAKDDASASMAAPSIPADAEPAAQEVRTQEVKAAPKVVKAPKPTVESGAQPIVSDQIDPSCSGDSQSNSTGIYSGQNTGSSQIVPIAGKEAARIRSSPQFGSNVITCLLPSHTVSRTGETDGIWSRVQLGNGTRGWIATSQLRS